MWPQLGEVFVVNQQSLLFIATVSWIVGPVVLATVWYFDHR